MRDRDREREREREIYRRFIYRFVTCRRYESGDEKTKIYGANELRRKELGRVRGYESKKYDYEGSENIFVHVYKIFPV